MSARLRLLNRRIHIWLGLALLGFTILFSGTGLLLNHHWAFADFWPKRQVSITGSRITPPPAGDDLAVARDVMRQLHLRGEISSTEMTPQGAFSFQAARPGESLKVEVDVPGRLARVERTRVNGWGVVRTLHTFVGVSLDDPKRVRDWWLTSLWSLAVDLTAFGLILLVAGGLYEAWTANPRRAPGLAVLAAALGCCAAVIAGLWP